MENIKEKEIKYTKGEGKIVNWTTFYCKKCEKQFESKGGLYSHLINAKVHWRNRKNLEENKKKKAENLKEKFFNIKNLSQKFVKQHKTLDQFGREDNL